MKCPINKKKNFHNENEPKSKSPTDIVPAHINECS